MSADAGRGGVSAGPSHGPTCHSGQGEIMRREMSSDSRRDISHARAALEMLLGPATERTYAVRYWDGSEEPAGRSGGDADPEPPAGLAVRPGGASAFTLVVRSPGAVR